MAPEMAREARALYKDSLSPFWDDEEDTFWIRTVYEAEAYRDGNSNLTGEEARRAHRSLEKCIRGWGFTYYSTSCLREVVRHEFGPSRYENLRDSQNPALLGWLLSRTVDQPILREVLFNRDEMRQVLSLMGQSQPDRQGDFPQWNRLLMHWSLATAAHESFGGPNEVLPPLLFDEAVPFLEEDLFERNHGVENIRAASSDPSTLRSFLFVGNARTAIEAISQWGSRGYDPEPLFRLAETSPRIEVVAAVFWSLQNYRDERVISFLVGQLIEGSFSLHLFARKALLASQDRDRVRAKMESLATTGDLFSRTAAHDVLRKMLQMPSPEETTSSADGRWNTYITDFFRFSSELKWIADEVRGLVRDWPEVQPVRLVSVGASYGPEVLSILMFLDSDYLRDPEGWGGLSPWDRVEIVATDIDPVALAYGARGRFSNHPCLQLSDVRGLELNAARLGIPLEQYFRIDPERRIYQLRPEWAELIRTEPLDILHPDPFIARFGRPEGVFYNMVDCHLGDYEAQVAGAENVARLTGVFAAVAPRSQLTVGVLGLFMTLEKREGVEYLFYPRVEERSSFGTKR